MLTASWETYATLLANATTDDALIDALNTIVSSAEVNLSTPAIVVYGYDTRPSSLALVEALEAGLKVMGCEIVRGGLLTTPQLHYLVKCYNTEDTSDAYGVPTEEGYYAKLAKAYTTLSVSLLSRNSISFLTIFGLGGKETALSDHGRLCERSRSAKTASLRRSHRSVDFTPPHHQKRNHDHRSVKFSMRSRLRQDATTSTARRLSRPAPALLLIRRRCRSNCLLLCGRRRCVPSPGWRQDFWVGRWVPH